jgi:hypothetical protein
MGNSQGTVTELVSTIPPLVWIPRIDGHQIRSFVEAQTSKGKQNAQMHVIRDEATRVLGRCIDPKAAASVSTGLVVGRVQSGKTMSFTALAALAHDNGFGIVIVIAGTKNNLIEQTVSRLELDLGINENIVGPWVIFRNPNLRDDSGLRLREAIERWRDPNVSVDRRRVSLVCVLKHSGRLNDLSLVLKAAGVNETPVIVIDDEADQSGLNTYARRNRITGENRMSSNYASIRKLRSHLPFHAYVQYTATPQANLLVSLNDELSPNFAEVLTTGSDYIGGQTLFGATSPYVAIIPTGDLPANRPSSLTDIPPSLVEAFAVFVYGCAYSESLNSVSIRTMMVHPSQSTAPHKKYVTWTGQLLEEWRKGLADIERADYIYDYLERGRKVLQATFSDNLPPPRQLKIYDVIRSIQLREVNATPGGKSKIRWGDSFYWLLVGGAKLDRGFTVEGLTVTYMPRPLGDGNADSVQQRARFFGYKRSYLQYCRIYVDSDVKDAFENYVEHEEAIHAELVSHRGYPLGDWPRKFMLHAALSLTRQGVVGIDVGEYDLVGWSQQSAPPKSLEDIRHNTDVIHSFISQLPTEMRSVAAEAYPTIFRDKREGKDSYRHWVYQNVSANLFIKGFLSAYKVCSAEDSKLLTSLHFFLQRSLQFNEKSCVDLFVMRDYETSRRSYNAGRINPFQGPSPAGASDFNDLTYSGDKSFHFNDQITVQLHFFDIYKSSDIRAEKVASNCPWLCIYVPEDMGRTVHLDEDT